MAKKAMPKIREVDLSQIDEPHETARMEISEESISELAQSISEIGLLQPITVRTNHDRYEIIYGHRRYLAHLKLGLSGIKSIITTMTDQEAAVARATENLAREDLTPIEEAATYKNLMDQHGMSVDQIAAKVGKSLGVVMRRMDLLRMPPCLQQATHEGTISMTVAEELWAIRDPVKLDYYLSFAVDGGCTQATARQWCKDWKDSERRQVSGDAEGGGVTSPFEPRPHYITCDICLNPVLIQEASSVMICGGCQGVITEKQKEV